MAARLLTLLSTIAAASAASTSSSTGSATSWTTTTDDVAPRTVHEGVIPEGWKAVERAESEREITLRITLPAAQGEEALHSTLAAISDPENELYGQHLSRDQLALLVAPRAGHSDGVAEWLASVGLGRDVVGSSAGGDVLTVATTVGVAEELLAPAEYWVYQSEKEPERTTVRTVSWGVPQELEQAVDSVHPTTLFPPLVSRRSFVDEEEEDFEDEEDLIEGEEEDELEKRAPTLLEKTPKRKHKVAKHAAAKKHKKSSKKKTSSSKTNKDAKKASKSSSKKKTSKSATKKKTTSGVLMHKHGKVSADCEENFTPDCARALYNLGSYAFPSAAKNGIYVYGEGAKTSTTYLRNYMNRYNKKHASTSFKTVLTKGAKQNGPIGYGTEATLDIDILVSLTAPTPVTLVDVPYSKNDYDEPGQWLQFVDYILDQQTVPTVASISYGTDENEMFKDKSAAKVSKQLCNAFAQLGARGVSVLVSSGDSGAGGSNKKYAPDFPVSCPYVTAVGATQWIPEEVAEFSGGGFSNQWTRPAWQNAAVTAYLKTLGSKDKGRFNPNGRAYPDVAAYGTNWATYEEEGFTGESGTSASAPNVAAIIAALNDVQLSQGKKPLGFLNPWIYQTTYKTGWQDITKGSNDEVNDGFPAAKGWDPTTGWGTPDFAALEKLLP